MRQAISTPIKCGTMFKKGRLRTNWKEKWFELHQNVLRYHTAKDGQFIRQIELTGQGTALYAQIAPWSQKTGNSRSTKFRFIITVVRPTGTEKLMCAAPNDEDMKDWIACFHALSNKGMHEWEQGRTSVTMSIASHARSHEGVRIPAGLGGAAGLGPGLGRQVRSP